MAQSDINLSDAFKLIGEEASVAVHDRKRVADRAKLRPKEDMGDFMRVVLGLEPAKHHRKWLHAFQTLLPEVKRLLIIAPPGSAKTTLAGVLYPSYQIGQDISRHFLYYGSAGMQAEKQSIAVRDLVLDPAYQSVFPHVQRSRTKPWSSSMWYVERPHSWDKDPTFWAVGIDGPSLGARADELIFDDICDPENMATAYQRKKVRDKVAGVAFSRQSGVSKDAKMLAIMTRWHEDDIAQFFEQEGFYVIWMPALGYWEYVDGFEPVVLEELGDFPQLANLEEGGALWPEQYPKEGYETTRRSSPDIWLLEYQGLAVRAGGNVFKEEMFRWAGAEEGLKHLDPYTVNGVYQFWDTASKTGDLNDYSVCQTWAWANDGYYMLRCSQYKLEFPELCAAVQKEYERGVVLPDADGQMIELRPRSVWVESTGTNNGAAVVDTLKRKRIPVRENVPTTSKVERGGAAVTLLQDKPFYHWAADSAWVGVSRRAFMDQHKSFPRSKHDDHVDVTSAALDKLSNFPVQDGSPQPTKRLTGTEAKPRLVAAGMPSAGRVKRGMFGHTGAIGGRRRLAQQSPHDW